MQIGLFGGSFDPPHLGHQKVVAEVLALSQANQPLFEQVWYIPVGNHDFGKQLAPAEHRIAMLNLILQPDSRIETWEINQPGTSYTHSTLLEMQSQYPEHSFSWIIGSDQLPSLYKWGCDQEGACFPELLRAFPFYVYPRAGYSMDLPYPELKPLHDVTEVKISSTEIRERIKDKQDISDLVAPQVAAYIAEHGLYR